MDTIFENSWKYTQENLKILCALVWPTWHKIFFAAAMVLVLGSGIFSLYVKFYYWALIFLATGILLIIIRYLQRTGWVKKMQKMLKEQYGDEMPLMTVRFADDAVTIFNEKSGAKTEMRYESLAKCRETDSYFFLLTKSGLHTILDKDLFTVGAQKDFLPFLKSKAPQAKYS